jgi:hypothetical protein
MPRYSDAEDHSQREDLKPPIQPWIPPDARKKDRIEPDIGAEQAHQAQRFGGGGAICGAELNWIGIGFEGLVEANRNAVDRMRQSVVHAHEPIGGGGGGGTRDAHAPPVESRALAFIKVRLERVDRARAATKNPGVQRPDRSGQGDVDQDENAVVAKSVEEASERVRGAGCTCNHAIQSVGDEPRRGEQKSGACERPKIPSRIRKSRKSSEGQSADRNGVGRNAP